MSDDSAASDVKGKTEEETRVDSESSSVKPTASTSAEGTSEHKHETAADSPAAQTEHAESSSEQNKIARLQQFMADMLHIGGHTEVNRKPLEEVSFEGIARYIRSGKCKNIITMVGAGISTAAGIPDFRSPGSGLYDNLQQYNLPNPQAIFMINFFKENPKPFFVLAKELFPGSLKPTLSHYFIRMLDSKGLLLRHYTQNIDTLERVAGLPEDKLVEAHGTFHTAHCLTCHTKYTLPWMKEKIFADKIPTCTKKDCTGVVKPDIVFFGEILPGRFIQCVKTDFKKCDLLIVMGTSLVVHPFASLLSWVPLFTPRLYINLNKSVDDSSEGDLMGPMMSGTSEFMFDDEDNYRDVFKQDTCDNGCEALADLLGWGDELRKLMKEDHARIDKEMASPGGTSQGGASAL